MLVVALAPARAHASGPILSFGDDSMSFGVNLGYLEAGSGGLLLVVGLRPRLFLSLVLVHLYAGETIHLTGNDPRFTTELGVLVKLPLPVHLPGTKRIVAHP